MILPLVIPFLVQPSQAAITPAVKPLMNAKTSETIPRPPVWSKQVYLKRAFAAAQHGRWGTVRRLAKNIRSPMAHKILHWLRITGRGGRKSYGEIVAFMQQNPRWPRMLRLRYRAESRLPAMPPRRLVAWFKKHPPLSARAKFRYGNALRATGRKKQALKIIRRTWIEGKFNKPARIRILARYGKHLRPKDHIARLNRLLWKGRAKPVQQILPLVPEDIRNLAIARLALRKNSPKAKKAVATVNKKYLQHPGLLYEQVRRLRKRRKHEKARELMFKAPGKLGLRPDLWWQERALQIRFWLAKKNYAAAYELAKSHKQNPKHRVYGARDFGEAEWLAGWLALRFRKRPRAALDHFLAFEKTVNYPISIARANYWIGRANEALKNPAAAERRYRKAAAHGATYYGQLATEALGGALPWSIKIIQADSFGPQLEFEARELVRVLRYLHGAQLKQQMRPFFLHLAWTSRDLDERRMIANLAVELEAPGIAVRVGKVGALRADPPNAMGHPYIELLDSKVEPALVYALIRQESEFREKVSSRVGARGLMQIMPATGRRLAKLLNLPFFLNNLFDAEYNMTLGTRYLANLIRRYSGSYIMAVAAYNAGEHRVDRWIGIFGDPRLASTNSIDWMEKIPFHETRNYVQRVMENLQIYRWKVAQKPATPLGEKKNKAGSSASDPAVDARAEAKRGSGVETRQSPRSPKLSLNAVLIQPRLIKAHAALAKSAKQPAPGTATK